MTICINTIHSGRDGFNKKSKNGKNDSEGERLFEGVGGTVCGPSGGVSAALIIKDY